MKSWNRLSWNLRERGEDLEDIREEEDLKVEEARAKCMRPEEDYEDVDYRGKGKSGRLAKGV